MIKVATVLSGTMTLISLATSYGKRNGSCAPFDGLILFSDASELWGLSESTLRKAVAYGKIVPGVDARKYGKQWIANRDTMNREYGNPVC